MEVSPEPCMDLSSEPCVDLSPALRRQTSLRHLPLLAGVQHGWRRGFSKAPWILRCLRMSGPGRYPGEQAHFLDGKTELRECRGLVQGHSC